MAGHFSELCTELLISVLAFTSIGYSFPDTYETVVKNSFVGLFIVTSFSCSTRVSSVFKVRDDTPNSLCHTIHQVWDVPFTTFSVFILANSNGSEYERVPEYRGLTHGVHL